MSVTAPSGFQAAGIDAGLTSGTRPDLAVLAAEHPAAAVGLFTRNAFPAAPVLLSRRHVAGGRAKAVVVNAGQANAGTGAEGLADATATAEEAAARLGCPSEQILICSTGVIGPRVSADRIRKALPRAVAALSGDGGSLFARAILTTDAGPKETVAEGEGFLVGGCVKGAGMIAPDLATMLAFLTTDAAVEPAVLDATVRQAVAPVFNTLTVDGCTSTNDTVLVLASGSSGVRVEPGNPAAVSFEAALREAAEDLAKQLVLGAEGANRALVVQVEGAPSDEAARELSLAVAGSLLVKTAVFGGDPNVGRLLQAIGDTSVPLDPDDLEIELGGQPVIAGGRVIGFDQDASRAALKEREVLIRARVGTGAGSATGFGCDLGYEYVRLNAEYTT
jgi:glutamate N-acetyltransferase/amino-acid N-acetyltransferase